MNATGDALITLLVERQARAQAADRQQRLEAVGVNLR